MAFKIEISPFRAGLTSGLLAFAVSAFAVWMLYIKSGRAVRSQVRAHLSQASYEAAHAIDGNLHATLLRPDQENSPAYLTALAPLKQRKEGSPGFKYLYTCVLRHDSVFFVLDPTPLGDADKDGIEDHSFLMSYYDSPSPSLLKALKTGQPQVDEKPTTDEWGTFMSGFSPIATPPGALPAVVGIDMDVHEYLGRFAQVRHAFEWSLIISFLLSFALSLLAYKSRKELENRIRDLSQAKEASEAGARAKDQFLATMSHELRTPLNGILGMSHLLRETELSSEQIQFVETLSQSGEGLLTLINDILDLSKIEAGRLVCEEIEFDLHRLCENVLELFAQRASEKGLRLLIQWSPEMPDRILGDPGRLRQILLNLVGNALKFTDQGYAIITVQKVKASQFRLEVQDSGIGIPKIQEKNLFKTFSQADPSTTRRFGGTGLGLSISKKLTELMNGNIGMTSLEGKGSIFWVELPLKVSQPNALATQSQKPNPGKLATLEAIPRGSIVVLDASQKSREVLCEQLANLGYACHPAENREEAIALLQFLKSPPKVMFISAGLGVLTESSVAKEVRNLPGLAQLPLVFITHLAVKGDALRVREIGFDGFFTLPLRIEYIPKLMQELERRNYTHDSESLLITQHLLGETHEPQAQSQPKEVAPPLPDWKPVVATRLPDEKSTVDGDLNILLVEDNQVNQMVAQKFLKSFGLNPVLAVNGLEAIEHCRKEKFRAILMDCQMPVMDGYEATTVIRSENLCPQTPIIAMTANALSGDRERCLKVGMDDYLAKPFRPEALKTILEKHLGKWTNTVTSPTLRGDG